MSLRPDPNLFNNVSHFPEKRADLYARELDERLAAIRTRASELAAKEGALQIGDDIVPELIARHERATQALWQSEGRCASWFIVGPANFPVERERKRQRSRDKRAEEVQAHLQAALSRLDRIAFPHGQGNAIRSADPDALDKLRAKLADKERFHDLAKKANAILRKHGTASRPHLEAAGLPTDLVNRALQCDQSGKPWGFFTTNSNAEINRLKDRIRILDASKARGSTSQQGPDGVRLVENAEAQRVQLVFPDKPDPETRALLKSNGFRWAPSEGAWQRHLNNAGRWAGERVLKSLAREA